MFRLDYLSCFLTVLSTILVARKFWGGLVVAGMNSAIICVIGLRTSQFGFIPANLFCIVVYALSIRFWARKQPAAPASARASEFVAARPLARAQSLTSKVGIHVVYRANVYERTRGGSGNPSEEAAPKAGSSARN